jgi:ketosteroid isomerase-like protein
MTDGIGAELEMWAAERACERLMYRYAQYVDFGQAARIAELFAENGAWLGADGNGMRGRQAIHDGFAQRAALTRRQSRHVITNVLIDLASSDSATGIAYLVNYRHDAASEHAERPAPAGLPKFVGEYHLTFTRVERVWLIDTLRFELAFLRRHST